ncbi:hypothetical protein G5714_014520 [Onychostoma macrolepis]|uniref:Ig-like domain-containing protein n=1 Tax=Onychostoma macrolepis TaxID=369639 RepID=A0A7J6CD23_9TELE|nr:hypothetical protein G5714_014520 [Onychostoma macrolepis]
MLVFGLMLLLQTAACLDRFCRFNQSDICYAALGHKLNLLNPRNTDNRIQKRINNNKTTDPVCRIKNGKMRETECDLYSNRPEVTVINGTLIINRVIRADSGNYTVTLFHCSGCSETSTDLQVNVEAPIGSVEVSIICSSSGMMRGSCSSEGDQILYSWTLNGDPLMDGNSSIDLDEGTDGNISCSVKNHVSHGQETVTAKPCPGPTTASVTSTVTKDSENGMSFSSAVGNELFTTVLKFEFDRVSFFHSFICPLIALGCIALILILLFIIVYHIYKKKQVKSTPAAAGNEDVIYADISHKKKSETKKTESLPAAGVEYVEIQPQKRRKERKEKEEEVQYGEVIFNLNRSSARTRPQEECIYSQLADVMT